MSDPHEIQIEIGEREAIEAANRGDFALYNTLLSYRISAQGIQPDPRIISIEDVREMYRPYPIYSAGKITGFEWRAYVACPDCCTCDVCNGPGTQIADMRIIVTDVNGYIARIDF
ncbi:MAG: hypothetical protein GY862_06855, partial [Gammaproteobacteria bacterium]|nr:hypothetical protein [Gammaproteobacteria bacterium]